MFTLDINGNAVCEDGRVIPPTHRWWQEEVQPWLDAGNVLQARELAFSDILVATDRAIESWLDGFVQQRNYKSIESCISYMGDEDLFFAAEALAAKRWRSAVYSAARAMMQNPPAGVTPYNITEHLPQPETFEWPEQLVAPISLETAPLLPEA